MINGLLAELHELQHRAKENACAKIIREYVEKNPGTGNDIDVFEGEPYLVPFFSKNGRRHSDGTEAEAYRIKCNGTLDTVARIAYCETFPGEPDEPDDYQWELLPLENADEKAVDHGN